MNDNLTEVIRHILGVRDKIKAGGGIGNVRASYDMVCKSGETEFNDPILYEIGFSKEETWLRDDYISLKISWRVAEELMASANKSSME